MDTYKKSWTAKRIFAALAFTATAALGLSACSGGGGGTADEASEGGTLTMATFQATRSLDPTQAPGTGNSEGAELAAIYDTVMTYDYETGEFSPNTAESLESNEDFTEWTLRLRPGIEFSDGSPYDSAAVVSSMQRHTEARSNASSLLALISDYATPDDLTVVFTLSAPWNKFAYALASNPGMIVNPVAVESLGEDLGVNPEGAGAGPFIIDSFRPNESVDLVRNPNYWGGDVALEGVKFINAGDGSSTLESFRAKAVDVAFMREAGAVADALDAGFDHVSVPYSANDTMIMNNGLPIRCSGGEPAEYCADAADGEVMQSNTATADVRIRQAVAAAMDLETLNDRAWGGQGTMTTSLIGEESRYYDGVEGPKYDPERAKELVSAAKADGWDGTIRAACYSSSPDWGPAVSGMLEAVGFNVDLTDQQDFAAMYNSVVIQRNYDLACFGSSISDVEPFFAINRDFNSYYVEMGGGNFAGYVNPEVDAAIARGQSAPDEAGVKAALKEVAEAYTRDVPFLALTAQPEVILLSEDIEGVHVTANSIVLLGKASFK